MVNILLESYDADSPWLYKELKHYILPNHNVVVVPFSFRDSRVRNLDDWNLLYSKENGKFYKDIISIFGSYGIPEKNITFLNYFSDSKETAHQKAEQADVIHFLGGLSDRMMDRIKEFELLDLFLHHKGVVMGYSAGAVIQLAEYHLSADGDYPFFSYYEGIPYITNFYLQVHYENTKEQNDAICRVTRERRKTVYALHRNEGAIIVENGSVKLLGKVSVFKDE